MVTDTVLSIVADNLGMSIDEVTLDSRFIEDLGVDSLDFVTLGMAFEEKFELEISDEDVEKIRTVREARDYIEKRLSYK